MLIYMNFSECRTSVNAVERNQLAVVKDWYSDNKWQSPTQCDAQATLAFSLDCIIGGTAEEQP